MEEWKEYKIGDICSHVCSGGTPSSKHAEYYDGDIPWLNTKEINFNRIYNTEKCITEEGLNNSSAKWIAENSVIVAMYGATAGKTAIAKIPVTTNQACCNLTIDSTMADYRFVYYFLRYKFVELASLANGGAQQNLNAQIIKDFDIVLPSLKKQTQISDLLSSFDDKIEVNRRINDNLEQQAQALFKSWFVDFEPFRDQPFVESELGMIPEGWRVIELEETCTIRYGKGLGKKDLTQDGFPVFGGNGIIGFYTHFLYELPQILVSCRGAASGKIIESLPKSYVTSNSLVLELKDRSYYNYIKLLLLNNPLYDYATGSAQPQITIDNIKGIKIILPLKEVINKVNHTLENIGSIQRNNNEESRRLASLRDTLLPRLMSGEIKVGDVTL